MRPLGLRSLVLAIISQLVAAAAPVIVHAVVLWTMLGTPLSAQTNVSTTFTLTATSEELLTRIGCVQVNTTAAFAVGGTWIVSAPAGREWVASHAGNVVTAHAVDGGDRLQFLQSVRIAVAATPLVTGTKNWTALAFSDHACGGSPLAGVPVVTIIVSQGPPPPTPTPVPTPTPAPRPTPVPTPPPAPTPTPPPTPPTPTPTPLIPLPTPTLPVPTPTLPVPTLPVPTLPVPTLPVPTVPAPTPPPRPTTALSPTPMPTVAPSASVRETDDPTPSEDARETPEPASSNGPASPEPSRSASTSPGSQGGAGGSGQGGAPDGVAGDGPVLALVEGVTDAGIGLGVFGVLDGGQVWFVPAAAVGVPGLLVILWVALQTLGALAWIPAVRRMRGDERPRRRRVRA